jgi:acyl dehydratase
VCRGDVVAERTTDEQPAHADACGRKTAPLPRALAQGRPTMYRWLFVCFTAGERHRSRRT